jgi:hypothetical protein
VTPEWEVPSHGIAESTDGCSSDGASQPIRGPRDPADRNSLSSTPLRSPSDHHPPRLHETREARRRLKVRPEPYLRLMHESLHLGYRKGPRGGVWLARVYAKGRYRKKVLGKADDTQDADGQNLLSFQQAQRLVLGATTSGKQGAASAAPLLTVAEAS